MATIIHDGGNNSTQQCTHNLKSQHARKQQGCQQPQGGDDLSDLPSPVGKKKKSPAPVRKPLNEDEEPPAITWKRRKRSDDELPASSAEAVSVEEKAEGSEVEASKRKVPDPSQPIVENEPLAALIKSSCVCRCCRQVDTVILSFPSVAIATVPDIVCSNCGRWTKSTAAGTSLPAAIRKGKEKVFRSPICRERLVRVVLEIFHLEMTEPKQ